MNDAEREYPVFQLLVHKKGGSVCFEAWQGEELIARHEVVMAGFKDRAGVQAALDQTFSAFMREVGDWVINKTPIM